MPSRKAIEHIAGIIFLLLVAFAIVYVATKTNSDTDVGEFTGTLLDIAADDEIHLVGASFGMVSSLLAIAVGAAIYMVFRPHLRDLALLPAFGFLAAGLTFMIANIADFSIEPLAREFAVSGGVHADTVATSARSLALVGEFSFEIAATFFGLGVLLIGALIARSGALHRPLGWLAILSGILMLFHWLGLAQDNLVWISGAGFIGTLVFFLAGGTIILVRGTSGARDEQPTPSS